MINNPPKDGEYRVVNQFDEQHSVMELAKKIQKIGNKKKLNVKIKNNLRKEAEKHYYKADHHTLKKLGFKRTRNIDDEIEIMLNHLIKFKKIH